MIDLQRCWDVLRVGHSCTIFVPESVVSRVLSNAVFEEACCIREVSLDEGEYSESKSYVRIFWLQIMSLEVGSHHQVNV